MHEPELVANKCWQLFFERKGWVCQAWIPIYTNNLGVSIYRTIWVDFCLKITEKSTVHLSSIVSSGRASQKYLGGLGEIGSTHYL